MLLCVTVFNSIKKINDLGIDANGICVLLRRSREALKIAYFDEVSTVCPLVVFRRALDLINKYKLLKIKTKNNCCVETDVIYFF